MKRFWGGLNAVKNVMERVRERILSRMRAMSGSGAGMGGPGALGAGGFV